MPNRIIKESICTSDNIDSLSSFEETVFYRLMVNCDDYGRFDGREKILAARLFPLKTLKDHQMFKAISALVNADLVIAYVVDGKPYVQLKSWERHQQIRNSKSKYPSPDEAQSCTDFQPIDINCNQLKSIDIKSSRNPIQSNTKSESNTYAYRFPPTLEEVAEYCRERNNNIDPQYFMDYQASRGWVLSNGKKMRDWKATIRTWEAHEKKGKAVNAQGYSQRDYSSEDAEAMRRMMELPEAR